MLNISVIIPCYNNKYQLKIILAAFSKQSYDLSKFEIIVIDDGSKKSLNPTIKNYSNILNIQYIREVHSGNRAGLRNKGITLARGKKIIFLDGDMVVPSNFVELHDNNTINSKEFTFGNRIFLDDMKREIITEDTVKNHFKIFEEFPGRLDERKWLIEYLKELGEPLDDKWYFVFTNNICVWKNELISITGFDGNFDYHWGVEDVDLGYRLIKNGCKLKYIEDLNCYHLPHKEDWVDKFLSLKENVKYFFNKYKNWETEIYRYDHKIFGKNFMDLFLFIRDKKHLLPDTKFSDIQANSISIGITDETFNNHHNIKVILNTETQKYNLLGTELDFKDSSFDYVYISKNYDNLPTGLAQIIETECLRISKYAVYYIDDTDYGFRKLVTADQTEEKLKVIINLPVHYNYWTFDFLNYYFLALACAEKELDIYARLPFVKGKLFQGLGQFDDNKKQNKILQLSENNLDYHDYVPAIVDDSLGANLVKSIGSKIFWGEVKYLNDNREQIIGRDLNRILYRRNNDRDIIDSYKAFHLPVGVNAENMKYVTKVKDKHTFIWLNPSICDEQPFEEMVQAFKTTFKNNKNAKLEIILSEDVVWQDLELKTDLFQNKQMMDYNDKIFHKTKVLQAEVLNRLNKCINDDGRIVVTKKNESYEVLIDKISKAEYLIDTAFSDIINPLIIEAYALGTKIIRYQNKTYEGYIDHIIPLQFDIKSFINMQPKFENIESYSISLNRHFLGYFCKKKCIDDTFKSLETGRALTNEERINYYQIHDWSRVADTLVSYLSTIKDEDEIERLEYEKGKKEDEED